MKFYNKKVVMSDPFYHRYYLPDMSFKEYITRENFFRKIDGGEDEIIKAINTDYLDICNDYFTSDILFYDELSKYLLDDNMQFKPLDELIFFKICYYAIKLLNILYDGHNFLEDERQKFIQNNYDAAIIALSKSQFHDAEAFFQYKNNILQICYKFGTIEHIFEFHGVKEWKEKEFMKIKPKLWVEELYEENQGVFVYNTLWTHEDIEDVGCSELTVEFTKLIQVK